MAEHHRKSGWYSKFANAIRGIGVGVLGQNSFYVHVPVATIVLAVAIWLQINALAFSILLICVGTVLAAELFNSALELLARAITDEHDELIRNALDVSSGAVLVVACFAAIVGVIVILAAGDWQAIGL